MYGIAPSSVISGLFIRTGFIVKQSRLLMYYCVYIHGAVVKPLRFSESLFHKNAGNRFLSNLAAIKTCCETMITKLSAFLR